MIIVIPDLHLKMKEPFHYAQKQFIDWFLSQSFNNKNNILIQLGDFFDLARPEPIIVDTAINFLQKCKFKEVIILRGNGQHEFEGVKQTFATDCLQSIKKVKIINYIQQEVLEGKNFYFIPAIPNYYFESDTWKHTYLKEFESVKDTVFDYVLGHCNDSDTRMWDYIDIKTLVKSNNYVMGHLHNKYLGVCVANKIDEKDVKKQVMMIDDKIDYIEIPEFIQYREITYPEKVSESLNTLYIIKGKHKKIVEDYYKDIHVHSVIIDNEDNSFTEENREIETQKIDLNQLFHMFCQENLIRNCVKDYCKEKM